MLHTGSNRMVGAGRTSRAAGLAAVLFVGLPLASGQDAAPSAERVLLETPDPARFGAHLRYLTEEPHMAGSPRNMELADYVRDRFREYGLEEVHFHDTPALYGTGEAASAEIVVPGEPGPEAQGGRPSGRQGQLPLLAIRRSSPFTSTQPPAT